jgi:hypothetical protein
MDEHRPTPPVASQPGTGRPDPGPAPVGPAVRTPPQEPARTPRDPGPAPVGPAVRPNPKPG